MHKKIRNEKSGDYQNFQIFPFGWDIKIFLSIHSNSFLG